MPPWDAEYMAQFVSVDDTADPPCHTIVTTPIAKQPAPLPPRMVSVPPEHIHLATQPQQAPISSDLDDLSQYLKKLQDCFKKLKKDVMKFGHEHEDHTEVILKMQKFMDEYQKLRNEQDSHDEKFQHEVKDEEFRHRMSSEVLCAHRAARGSECAVSD